MNNLKIQPVSPKPAQFDLFSLVSDSYYVNLIPFYEAIPIFFPARWWAKSIKRNPDGTIAPIQRTFKYDDTRYRVVITPPFLEKNGTLEAHLPGAREERVQTALLKISQQESFLNENEAWHADSHSVAFTTTIYAIQKELSKTYSYSQIKDALDILSGTRYRVASEEGKSKYTTFSPIDLTYEEMPNGKDRLYIRFNPLLTQGVLRRVWRQVNYELLLEDKSYFSRWLRKRFSLRFSHANHTDTTCKYHLSLTTILQESWIWPYEKLSLAHNFVTKTFDNLVDIIDWYKCEKKYISWKRGWRTLVDVIYTFKPTYAFAEEQKKINNHNIKLKLLAEQKKNTLFVKNS